MVQKLLRTIKRNLMVKNSTIEKVIVTGGLGYIGSHTVVELIKSGYEPVIIDNLSNTNVKNLNGINEICATNYKFHKANCADYESTKNILEGAENIVGLIHFAAYKSVEESINDPEKYYSNNIGSMNTLTQLCEELQIENFIFSSSCTVYGSPAVLPVNESAPFQKAFSPYGETKQQCENILENSKTHSVSLRYFNPIGSHSSAKIGDRSSDNPGNLVPIMAQVAAKKRKTLIVNGTDYNTKDGSCVRDYLHVIDLAKSHIAALNFVRNKKGKHAFNVGVGKGLSVIEAIQFFEEANNLSLEVKYGPRRAGDIPEIYADTTHSFKCLKWRPEISIKQAMKDAWNWELNK